MGLSFSDLDPFYSKGKLGSQIDRLGPLSPLNWGDGTDIDTSAIDEEKRIAAEAKKEYEDWQKRWGGLGDPNGSTGRRAGELRDVYNAEVDRGMYDAGTRVAAGFGRRGMEDSGYAQAGQASVVQAAAADRVRARERAWQDALSEGQSLLAGELPAMSAKYGTLFTPYITQAQMAMAQAQMDQQDKSDMMGGLSSLAMLALL